MNNVDLNVSGDREPEQAEKFCLGGCWLQFVAGAVLAELLYSFLVDFGGSIKAFMEGFNAVR